MKKPPRVWVVEWTETDDAPDWSLDMASGVWPLRWMAVQQRNGATKRIKERSAGRRHIKFRTACYTRVDPTPRRRQGR